MPRTRSIWPELLTKEELVGLTPLHRLLYASLPTQCDWMGRGDDKPTELRVRLLPLDDGADVDKLLSDLQSAGVLVRYVVDGKRYFELNREDWRRQNPHVKEKEMTPRPAMPQASTGHAPGKPDAGTVPTQGLPQASTGHAPGKPSDLLSLVTITDQEKRATAKRPPSPSPGQQALLPGARPTTKAPSKNTPSPAQRSARQMIAARFHEHQQRLGGAPFDQDAKFNAGVAQLEKKCGGDGAEACKLVDLFVAHMPSDRVWSKQFGPAFVASVIPAIRRLPKGTGHAGRRLAAVPVPDDFVAPDDTPTADGDR
jgi:hypothetical protein